MNTTLTSILIGYLQLLTYENEIGLKLMHVTKWIRDERYYHTLVYMRHDLINSEEIYNTDRIFKYLMEENEIVIINLKGNTTYYLWNQFDRRHMAISHLKGKKDEDEQLLEVLWKTLKRNVLSRLILLVNASAGEKYYEDIIRFCSEKKAINIMLMGESVRVTNEYYRPEIFPKFGLRKEKLVANNESTRLLYPDHIKDMQKHPLRLVLNKAGTKCYILQQEGDHFLLGGYVGHFLEAFAKKHNSILTFPNFDKLNSELFLVSLDKLVENGTYDVSTELSFNLYTNEVAYTDPYDYMDWCLMVPMEEPLPAFMFYAIVYDYICLSLILLAFLLFSIVLALTYVVKGQNIRFGEFLLNIYVLNGLLGQAFKMEPSFTGIRSCIYMLVCIAGLIFNTTYVTYLQTFNTSPPMEDAINSFEDIQRSGLQIAIYKHEFNLLDSYGVADQFKSFIKPIDSYEEFFKLRDSYDTRYVYTVALAQWFVYEQQQLFLTKPRFRLSDVCIIRMLSLSLPLQENSPYEQAMNNLIGQVIQSGIVTHWKTVAFLEAVQLKRISLNDSSQITTFQPMKLGDMKLFIFGFNAAIILIFICFCFEIYWPNRGVYGRKVVRKLKTIYDHYML